ATVAFAASYPVTADVKGRAGPSTSNDIIKVIPTGTLVDILCQTQGQDIFGDSIWAKVSTNPDVYVSDYYIKTGVSGYLPGVPRCSSTSGPDCPQKIISAAKTQFGWPYSWGGGDYFGPTLGIDDGEYHDSTVNGYDCSGLTMYAVYQATGKKIVHYTGSQYNDNQGIRVPFDQKQPGDLIFWANSVADRDNGDANRHVAIYVEGSTTIDA
ncbi:hypothetical protein GQ42DRAFT_110046, partial [Ramicandelaber brevisporus]